MGSLDGMVITLRFALLNQVLRDQPPSPANPVAATPYPSGEEPLANPAFDSEDELPLARISVGSGFGGSAICGFALHFWAASFKAYSGRGDS